MKTRTVAIGLVLPLETRDFDLTTSAPIKLLSYDRIMIWEPRRACCFSCSFTLRCQMYELTDIQGVPIECQRISHGMWPNFIATQRISVGLLIWMLEVKVHLIVHNQRVDHVTIRSELTYLIGAQVAGTVIRSRGLGATQPKNCGFVSSPGNYPAKTERFSFLAGCRTEPNHSSGPIQDCRRVTRNRC